MAIFPKRPGQERTSSQYWEEPSWTFRFLQTDTSTDSPLKKTMLQESRLTPSVLIQLLICLIILVCNVDGHALSGEIHPSGGFQLGDTSLQGGKHNVSSHRVQRSIEVCEERKDHVFAISRSLNSILLNEDEDAFSAKIKEMDCDKLIDLTVNKAIFLEHWNKNKVTSRYGNMPENFRDVDKFFKTPSRQNKHYFQMTDLSSKLKEILVKIDRLKSHSLKSRKEMLTELGCSRAKVSNEIGGRSASFGPPEYCPIKIHKLKNLLNILKSSTPSSLGDIACPEIFTEIRNYIKLLKENNKSSLSEESAIKRLQEDNTRKAEKQKYSTRLVEDQEILKNKSSIQELLHNNIRIYNELRDNTLQYVWTSVQCGNIKYAKGMFDKLSDVVSADSETVIREAYGSVEDVENILSFIETSFSNISQQIEAYSTLYHKMSQNGELKNLHVLRLAFGVETIRNTRNSEINVRNKLFELKKYVYINLDMFIKSFSNELLLFDNNPSITNMITYLRNSFQNADAFNHYLPDIIRAVYNRNAGNIVRVIHIIEHLPWVSQWVVGFETIFNEIKNNGHIDTPESILFAYRIKVNLHANIHTDLNTCLNQIKNQLPSPIKRFIWEEYIGLAPSSITCPGTDRIVSGYGRFMYTLYGSQPGNAYIYPDHNYEGEYQQRWTVEGQDNGRYFQFKNRENGKCLYVNEGGKLYTSKCKNKDKQFWRITPTRRGTEFILQNKKNHLFLSPGCLESCWTSISGKCGSVYTEHHFTGIVPTWTVV